MLISKLDLQKTDDGGARAIARIEWEEADRPPVDLYVAVDDRNAAAGLWPDPTALLTLCAIPAYKFGERRVHVEAQACPVLRDNVRAALLTLRHWFPEDFGDRLPAIEAAGRFVARRPEPHSQAAALMSCGVDSMATLRW